MVPPTESLEVTGEGLVDRRRLVAGRVQLAGLFGPRLWCVRPVGGAALAPPGQHAGDGRAEADAHGAAEGVAQLQLGVDAEKVNEKASFIDDLGADSLDTVELVMAFEEEFGIEIPDEDAEKMQTVGDAIEYIRSQQS